MKNLLLRGPFLLIFAKHLPLGNPHAEAYGSHTKSYSIRVYEYNVKKPLQKKKKIQCKKSSHVQSHI